MKKRFSALAASLCVTAGVLALSPEASATPAPTCVSFKRGVLGDVQDTSIWEVSNYPQGSDPEFDVGTYGGGEEQGLVQFGDDLSIIPAGSTIVSANLYLWSYPTATETIRVHRVIAPWEEGTVNWDSFGGYDPAIVDTIDVVQYSLGYYSADLTALTQQWVDGTYPEYGVLLETDQPAPTSIFFRASDFGVLAYQPHYDVCYIAPAAKISSDVFFDANDDGVQNPGEPGIPNVSVHLYSDSNCDGTGDASIGTTLTDANGHYTFASLDAGCYVVNVDDASLPAGYVTSTFNVPLAVSVADGQALSAAPFGYTTLESIGDQVWLDSNLDGIYEPELGEAGINGVTVNLYDENGLVGSTVTGNDPITGHPGHYLFTDVYPGGYVVAVAGSSFQAGGPLFGMEPSSDDDGVLDNMTNYTLVAGEDFLGADFGYRLTCGNGVCGDGESCSSCSADCGVCPPVCGNGTCENGETCDNCASDCGTCPPVCGNGTCETGEACDNCASDCGVCPPVCGNGTCENGETCSTCDQDCGACPPVCGNGACENGEACENCASDCGACQPVCGNGTCENGETCGTCSSDCGACPPACGNGTCETGETCANCASDCGVCPPVCGDGVCEGAETCGNCSADCGTCPAVCGNGTCEMGETCGSCATDCGACPPVCGNKLCEAGETCDSCATDCGACPPVCGNGTCESGEACSSCSNDCGTCPPPAPGTRTQGYWMTHPEAWPVQSLTLGGVTYTKTELIAILKAPVAKDVTYSLAQQLIAAKLNVAAGNNATCISSTITAADAWLKTYPIGSKVKGGSAAWTVGDPLKTTLDEYNNGLLCAKHAN